MRILGLDLGSKTLGIALSDSSEIVASMKETYRFPSEEYDYALNRALEYIDEYNIKLIALGFPKHMNGDIGEKAQLSIAFKDALENERDCHVELIDERLTTVISNKAMIDMGYSRAKRKGKVDSMAAAQILETYLRQRKNNAR